MDKDKIWQSVLAQVQLTLSRAIFSIWFSKTVIKSIKASGNKQIVEIGAQNSFIREKLEKKYGDQLKELFDSLTEKENELRFVVWQEIKEEKPEAKGPLFSFDPQKQHQSLFFKALTKARINQDYTFQNFAVASTNEMAFAAVSAVSKKPGENYNPLFIYGGGGVGKTHLMQAVGVEMLKKNPQASILYCTGEDFTNEIIEAIRARNTSFFKKKYRYVKLLMIDDIQFIAGKEAVQKEFFHTFNTLKQFGGQIILTSDKMPEEIDGLENRLRSRFEGGLTIDIQEPNFELRSAILLIKAKQMGENLPIEAAKLIAQRVKSTRKLEGILTRIISEKMLRKKEINIEMVNSIIPEFSSSENSFSKRTLRPDKIIKFVADFYGIKHAEIKGKRRLKQIVFPRQIAIYLLRNEVNLAYQEIGRIFGGKDHTTIMHSEKKIIKLIEESDQVRGEIENIKRGLI